MAMVALVIDRRDSRALYRQVADDLRSAVEHGVYERGDVLPSEAELSRHYGVGRDVARRALALLRQEGLITSVRGMSSRIREPAQRRLVTFHSGDELICRMPTDLELDAHRMDDGVPLLEIKR